MELQVAMGELGCAYKSGYCILLLIVNVYVFMQSLL